MEMAAKIENRTTLIVDARKLSEKDELFIDLVARGNRPIDAARQVYGIKGDDEQLAEFTEALMSMRPMILALARARADLTELGCLTRAEKRWVLSGYVREANDPELVMKALQLDNKMTGDEVVTIRDASVSEYVLRAGDVTEVAVETETPSGGGVPPDEYDGV